MARSVIISCALTGGGDTAGKNKAVPVTPEQIARSALEAASAGAAIVHIHVRDPDTGRPSIDPKLYREVVETIRDSGSDVLINLTTGAGARLSPSKADPRIGDDSSTFSTPETRAAHLTELRPPICSLDLGTMNFGEFVFMNTPTHVREIAGLAYAAGALPELEVFDLGHIRFAHQLIREGVLRTPAIFQLCLGIPWGAPANVETMLMMRNMLPEESIWSAFGIGAQQFPMLAQAFLLGGHVRVGLEDNLYLDKDTLAPSNAALVEKAVAILDSLGGVPASPAEARLLLGIE